MAEQWNWEYGDGLDFHARRGAWFAIRYFREGGVSDEVTFHCFTEEQAMQQWNHDLGHHLMEMIKYDLNNREWRCIHSSHGL
jgi:hypothetical protein